jgi:hypothetical protein
MGLADRFLDRVEAVLARLFSGGGAGPIPLSHFSAQNEAQGVTTKRAALPASVRPDLVQSTPCASRDPEGARGLTGQNQDQELTVALREAERSPKPFQTEKAEAEPLPNPLIPHLKREAMLGGPNGLRAFLALRRHCGDQVSEQHLCAIGDSLAREWSVERRAAEQRFTPNTPFTVIDGGAA